MQIDCSLNQKGGVGKSALVAGVGGALADRGQRVLVVDLDPQGHLTIEALGLTEADPTGPTLPDALTGDYRGPSAGLTARHSSTPDGGTLDVLPHALAMFTVTRDLDRLPAREWRLSRVLDALSEDYDHCLIDCPPALDILTDNALAASHGVVIPVQPERTSVRALDLLLQQIEALESALRRPRLTLHGLVPSVYRRPLGNLPAQVMHELSGSEHLPVLAHLPLSVSVTEAWAAGQPLTRYAPDSEHADAYRTVAATLREASA